MSPLHIPSFSGGIALLGSADAQRTDELELADSVDIGPRGQLVAASDVSDYTTVRDRQAVPLPLAQVYSIDDVVSDNVPYALLVGKGKDAGAVDQFYSAWFRREGEPANVLAAQVAGVGGGVLPPAIGTIVTLVQMPGTFLVNSAGPGRRNAVLGCFGAREGSFPKSNAGLMVAFSTPGAGPTYGFTPCSSVDALGTGASGEEGGSKGKRLYFRGICAWNGYAWGWGYDSADATNGDGPNRVMFSNPNKPLRWGNDNIATAGDRDFTDSDAIIIGDAGEIVRAGQKWNGRLYFGTNRELHYIAGFGRDSFLSDGANPVAKSYNVISAHGMIEGPDKLLYGVAEQGLWAFDGGSFEPHFKRLVRFDGHSSGYWDLIWTDPAAVGTYPGKTNQDLVWMAVDWDREQVLVGIPFCNAGGGAGAGTDTVVIKFHTRSGGFTRQVFAGINITAAGYFRRLGQQRETRFMGTATAGATVRRYAAQAAPTTSPILPTLLPDVRCGPYSAFGPDGDGVVRRAYLTLAWEATIALPIVFAITTRIDGSVVDAFTLTLAETAPALPVDGDVWVDTSGFNDSIGNASATVSVKATGGFLTMTRVSGKWMLVPGGGASGTRLTIPLPLTRRKGARCTLEAHCTAAAGRFQIEGLALEPGGGSANG